MAAYPDLALPENPRLADNIVHFARALRKAGLPVGPGRVIEAVRAIEAAGFTRKEDFYWALHAVFVSRPEQRVVFAQVFRLFWRDPRYLEHMMSLMLPAIRGVQEERRAEAGAKRAAESLLDGLEPEAPDLPDAPEEETKVEIDASMTMSARMPGPSSRLPSQRCAAGRAMPSRVISQPLRPGKLKEKILAFATLPNL